MSVGELYRYTMTKDDDFFSTLKHISHFYDFAKWQNKFLEVCTFARERRDMTTRESYRYNPLNYAELKETLDDIERHYDLAKMKDEVLQVYVFVKDGKNEEIHFSRKFDDEFQETRKEAEKLRRGETSFQN